MPPLHFSARNLCYTGLVLHRHLTGANVTSLAALDDVLERGDVADWLWLRDLVATDREVARKVLRLCKSHHMYGTSNLWDRYVRSLYNDEP